MGGVQSAKRLNKIKKAFHEYWNTERRCLQWKRRNRDIYIAGLFVAITGFYLPLSLYFIKCNFPDGSAGLWVDCSGTAVGLPLPAYLLIIINIQVVF